MPRQSDGLSPLARGTLNVVRRRRWKSRFIPAGAGNTWLGRSQNSGSAVYPRWRGEHFARSIAISPDHGLSPLARGTRYRAYRVRRHKRFIPAGAGNTLLWLRYWKSLPVYPRWRGEHTGSYYASSTHLGLSPLARGTLGHIQAAADQPRFIPAGAGNTPDCCRRRPARTVYPRWRGEHCCQYRMRGHDRGLSPLARGTLSGCVVFLQINRFIPAGAGNTG